MNKLNRLAELDIHSIEQPIRAGQIEEMARLVKETPIPIALDEELIGLTSLKSKAELLDKINPQYIILKPSLHVVVTPKKNGVAVDLKDLVDELQLRDVSAPMLLRFPDILDNRIEKTAKCFQIASEEYGYKAQNFIIYPIKVNQMRPVVEEIISHEGKPSNES